MAGYYDPKKDYSAEIEKAKASGASAATISQLQKERENKIADKYGGKEPTMTGSSKTYSELSGEGTSSSKREISNSILSTPGGSVSYTTAAGEKGLIYNKGKSWDEGVDYTDKAWKAAADTYSKVGYIDLDEIDDILMRRQDKMDATGSNGGGVSNLQLWNEILKAYDGALGPGKQSMSDIYGGTGKVQPVATAKPTGSSGISYSGALKESSGGGSSGGDLVSQLMGIYGEGGSYAEALKQQQAANQANVDKAVNALEGQKVDTNKEYSNLFKQLYLNKMATKKNLGQQMAAQGVTGGAAESTMLDLDTNYNEALRQGEEGRIAAVSGLDQAISDAQLTGDITNAQLAADNARESAGSYAAILQDLINRNDTLAAREEATAREDAENARAYAYQTAMQILQGGNMASDDLLNSAGISKADAASIVQEAMAAKQKASYGGGGYETPKKYTAAQAEVALAAALNGDRSNEVVATIEGYYGMPLNSVLGAYGSDGREEEIAAAAATFNAQHPAQEVDSWVVNTYLANSGFTGDEAELFKAYLRQYRS